MQNSYKILVFQLHVFIMNTQKMHTIWGEKINFMALRAATIKDIPGTQNMAL